MCGGKVTEPQINAEPSGDSGNSFRPFWLKNAEPSGTLTQLVFLSNSQKRELLFLSSIFTYSIVIKISSNFGREQLLADPTHVHLLPRQRLDFVQRLRSKRICL
jgi:hypothetical protein